MNWFNKFPPLRFKPLRVNVHSAVSVETAGKIYAKQSVPIGWSLEEKANFLVRQDEKIENELIKLDEKLDSRLTEANKALNELDKKIENINDKLDQIKFLIG